MKCLDFDGGVVIILQDKPRTIKVGDRVSLHCYDKLLDADGLITEIDKNDASIERWNKETIYLAMAPSADGRSLDMQTVVDIKEHPVYSSDHIFSVDKISAVVKLVFVEDEDEVEKTE